MSRSIADLVQRIEGYQHDYEIVSLYKDEDESVWRFEVKEVLVEEEK